MVAIGVPGGIIAGSGHQPSLNMSYIDVLIPGMIGLLLVTSPRIFTKAEGEMFEQTKAKLRMIGFGLIGVAVLYLLVKVLGKR